MRSDLLNGEQVKVGDPLILETHNHYRGDQPVTLARIGKSYLYVSTEHGELPEKFHRGTGIEYGNRHGYTQQLHTLAQYDEKKLRTALIAKLHAAGVDIPYQAQDKTPTSKLKALLAVMEDAAPAEEPDATAAAPPQTGTPDAHIEWAVERYGVLRGKVGSHELFTISPSTQRGDRTFHLDTKLPLPNEVTQPAYAAATTAAERLLTRFVHDLGASWGEPTSGLATHDDPHQCGNCEGTDPASCLMNPARSAAGPITQKRTAAPNADQRQAG